MFGRRCGASKICRALAAWAHGSTNLSEITAHNSGEAAVDGVGSRRDGAVGRSGGAGADVVVVVVEVVVVVVVVRGLAVPAEEVSARHLQVK